MTSPDYWNGIYAASGDASGEPWRPRGYAERALARVLLATVRDARPRTILEVGCGGSRWLPYLYRLTNAAVAGVDSSIAGCVLARSRLAAVGAGGAIHHVDVLTPAAEKLGTFDLVYSFGVVEHFARLSGIMPALAALVAPGGRLLTTVPNLKSIHGGAMAWWQPVVFAGHHITTAEMLASAYSRLGFTAVRCRHLGVASLDIVAWEHAPRWPLMAAVAAPFMRRAIGLTDRLLIAANVYRGTSRMAPFIAAIGIRPA